jgi:hypothetical protein
MVRWLNATTGSAKRSASAASEATPSALRPEARRALGARRGARQDLARQGEIDRPARRRHRHLEGARQHLVDLVGKLQLIVPFDDLAHHARLVEHLLRPLDVARARAEMAGLRQRRASGHEHHRHIVARRVDQRVDGVAGADIGVHHHRLRLARDHVDAVRHGDRRRLVRHQHRPRHRGAAVRGAGEAFDDRGEIGAGIGKEVVDPVRLQPHEQRVGRSGLVGAGGGFAVHGVSSGALPRLSCAFARRVKAGGRS